jgi:hypothetical protein
MSADKKNIRDMPPGEELKEYFAKIKSLPHLSAPVGFAERVMRKINETPDKKSFLSKLFMPFHVKLPIELAGVAVTVALLIIVYHPFGKMQELVPEKNREMTMTAPVEQKEEKQALAKPARSFAAKVKKAGKTDEKAPQVALAQKSAEAEPEEDRTFSAAAPAPKAMAPAPAGYSEPASAPSQKAGQEIPVQLVLSLGQGNPAVVYEEKLKKEVRTRASAENNMELMKQPVTGKKAIEQAVVEGNGSIVATEQDKPEKGMVLYRIKVPAISYDSLASCLARLGRLSVTHEPTDTSRGVINIELIIREMQ